MPVRPGLQARVRRDVRLPLPAMTTMNLYPGPQGMEDDVNAALKQAMLSLLTAINEATVAEDRLDHDQLEGVRTWGETFAYLCAGAPAEASPAEQPAQ